MIEIDPHRYRVTTNDTVSNIDLDKEEFIFRGERLTEARAEQISAEALRTARIKNLIPGRKSLSRNGSHSPSVQYRVPMDVRERVERLAERTGSTVSKIGRIALEEYLERHAG